MKHGVQEKETALILNDLKPNAFLGPFRILGETQRTSEKTGIIYPVLLLEDEQKKPYFTTSWDRDVIRLTKEWGEESDNWVGEMCMIRRSANGKSGELVPIVKPLSVETI